MSLAALPAIPLRLGELDLTLRAQARLDLSGKGQAGLDLIPPGTLLGREGDELAYTVLQELSSSRQGSGIVSIVQHR